MRVIGLVDGMGWNEASSLMGISESGPGVKSFVEATGRLASKCCCHSYRHSSSSRNFDFRASIRGGSDSDGERTAECAGRSGVESWHARFAAKLMHP